MDAYAREIRAQAATREQADVVLDFHERGYTKEERDYLSLCMAQTMIESCTEDELVQSVDVVKKLYWHSTTVNSLLTFRHVDTFANAVIHTTRHQIGGEKAEKIARYIKDTRNAAENAITDNAGVVLW